MRHFLIFFMVFSFCVKSRAQDPEFPKKEFITHFRIHSGMITTFKSTAPDIFAGGIQVIPQYTFVENKIRGGIVAGGFYGSKKIQGLAGPTISFKLKTLNAGFFGSGGNIHLSLDHLWGTKKQRLFGGGFNADIGNKIVLNLTLHRDYNLNNWWIQQGIAFRISKVKQPPHP